MWEAAQLEIQRCKKYCEEHGIGKLDYASSCDHVLCEKVVCGECGHVYGRRTWMSTDAKYKKIVWVCSNKYLRKGVKGCGSGHIDDTVLKEVFVTCFNTVLKNKDYFMEKWQSELGEGDILKKYRLEELVKVIKDQGEIEEFDEDLFLKILDHIILNENKIAILKFLDGTELKCEVVGS